MAKLWDKDYEIDSLVEKFTVGNDYLLDKSILLSDLIGSAAHAMGLEKIGLLGNGELKDILKTLNEIAVMRDKGEFEITLSDEDCHTAIENYLTDKIGEGGKKIHTGRSRNDQVLTALRLYMREALVLLSLSSLDFSSSLIELAKNNTETPMPGRTHMRLAMPSSVALWALSFAEETLDEVFLLKSIYPLFNASPLGSAASYGVPLPLDREYTATLMGFSSVQNNVLYANNSRGKYEAIFIDHEGYIALTLSKLASDLILFTLPEFGYFSLDRKMCTGSSIMPQKQNPDVLELVRSNCAAVLSFSVREKNIISSLPSGYNRDFQMTKEPLLLSFEMMMNMSAVMKRAIERMKVNKVNLAKAMKSEIYATDRAIEKVLKGESFRDSYKEVALNLDEVESMEAVEALKRRTSSGTTGNLNIEKSEKALDEMKIFFQKEKERLEKVYSSLLPGVRGVITS